MLSGYYNPTKQSLFKLFKSNINSEIKYGIANGIRNNSKKNYEWLGSKSNVSKKNIYAKVLPIKLVNKIMLVGSWGVISEVMSGF